MKQIIAVKKSLGRTTTFYSDYSYTIANKVSSNSGIWGISRTHLLYLRDGVYKESNLTMEEFNALRAAYQFDQELEELLNEK